MPTYTTGITSDNGSLMKAVPGKSSNHWDSQLLQSTRVSNDNPYVEDRCLKLAKYGQWPTKGFQP